VSTDGTALALRLMLTWLVDGLDALEQAVSGLSPADHGAATGGLMDLLAGTWTGAGQDPAQVARKLLASRQASLN
jgi:hypothetical protein